MNLRRPVLLLAVACLLPAAATIAQMPSSTTPPAANPAAPLLIGRFAGRFQNGGLYLDFDGVPLLRGGIVQVFSADGSDGYYGSGTNPPTPTVETLEDGGRAYTTQYAYAADGNRFTATQRIEVHPKNSISFTISAKWHGAQPASLEWNPVRFWAYPLLGATYQADYTTGPSVSGQIGLRSLGPGYPANRLASAWKRFTFRQTPLGEITLFPSDEGEGPTIYDAREDPFLKDEKRFWLGYNGLPLAPDQEVTRSLTLSLTPAQNAKEPAGQAEEARSAPELGSARLVPIPDAQRPAAPPLDADHRPIVIPQPKQIAFTGADYLLLPSQSYAMEMPAEAFDPRLQNGLAEFSRDLRRDTATRWTQVQGKGSGLTVTTSLPVAARLLGPETVLPSEAESYFLRVAPQGVVLYGKDAAGAFYGLQTLRQLLQRKAVGDWVFTGATITDWPSLPFRGAHIFVGRNALPFHQKLIERIFSRYKLNAMVIECEYTNWKSHPEIHVPNGMEPDALRADVAFARAHFLEPIPLINSLGHSEWIFKNNAHRDLAEDVDSPHAYDASNPETYKFIFDIFSEAVAIFQPRLFHIGHDEVKVPSYDRLGRYPARPENIAKGATQLFIEDTNRLADWLRQRGIRPIMWGDMLLHSSEGDPKAWFKMTAANAPTLADAQKLRAAMPHDIVLADWRYEPRSEQRNGLALFKSAGFDTLVGAWFQPENIRGWAQQAVQNHALGLLQTTWVGYDISERTLDSSLRQFTAYILAAEHAWSGGEAGSREEGKGKREKGREESEGAAGDGEKKAGGSAGALSLPYDAGEVFVRAFRDAPEIGTTQSGWFLDMTHAANMTLRGRSAETLPFAAYRPAKVTQGSAEGYPLPSLEYPTVADIGVRLTGSEPAGIMLRGTLNPALLPNDTGNPTPVAYPQAITLPLHGRAGTLAFLHATGYGVTPGTEVATYLLTYADGAQTSIPLRYGREIFALDDPAPNVLLATSPLTWNVSLPASAADGQPGSGQTTLPLTLRLLRWTNPRPGMEITNITFRAGNPYAAPILFAVTGVQSGAQ